LWTLPLTRRRSKSNRRLSQLFRKGGPRRRNTAKPKALNKIKKHHAAMAFEDVPEFCAGLRRSNLLEATALEFLILCAARTAEVLDRHAWPAGSSAR
jgi:hypothetical protein